ncbi:hypothetical protein BGP_2501 [Beggiatoa sp. PS]|nr:hypothetical protein BGP_2501 [Beggiatoa sp. PS]
MEQIVIQVTDREKAQLLYQLLSALDFVKTITTVEPDISISNASSTETQEDFFSFAGLWSNREDINIHSIRQNAWPIK